MPQVRGALNRKVQDGNRRTRGRSRHGKQFAAQRPGDLRWSDRPDGLFTLDRPNLNTCRLAHQLLSKNRTSLVYYSVSELLSPPAQDIIEIDPAPDLYVVEFEFSRHLGISVILPATCPLMAKLEAWRLFPEHKRNASAVSVFHAKYAEIDWETGRCFVMKRQKRVPIPLFVIDEPKTLRRKKRDEEGTV